MNRRQAAREARENRRNLPETGPVPDLRQGRAPADAGALLAALLPGHVFFR